MTNQSSPTTIYGEVALFLHDNLPAVSSKDIARNFQKKHKDVLRLIEGLKSLVPDGYHERNFAPMILEVKTGKGATRKIPAYKLTRDAFSLLAMGFTGKAAIKWKLRYIEAFNALEQHALEAARKEGMAQGVKAAQSITPLQQSIMKRVVNYHQKGLMQKEVAKLVDCSPDTVRRVLQKARALGLVDDNQPEQGA